MYSLFMRLKKNYALTLFTTYIPHAFAYKKVFSVYNILQKVVKLGKSRVVLPFALDLESALAIVIIGFVVDRCA